MNFSQAFKMAAKSISANKGRSALTMLGVIIGLAAVIILVSYAQGQNMALRAYYESMGTNTISVYAYSYRGNVDVSSALYDYCLQLDDLVLGVSPTGNVYSDPVIKFESKTIARQWQSMGGGAMMSTGEYPSIVLGNDKYGLCNDYKIAKGRDLSYLDIEKENQVCVLGSAVADELFGFADPVDKTITINGTPFLVVGVYESKSAGVNVGSSEENQWIQETINRQDYMILTTTSPSSSTSSRPRTPSRSRRSPPWSTASWPALSAATTAITTSTTPPATRMSRRRPTSSSSASWAASPPSPCWWAASAS